MKILYLHKAEANLGKHKIQYVTYTWHPLNSAKNYFITRCIQHTGTEHTGTCVHTCIYLENIQTDWIHSRMAMQKK